MATPIRRGGDSRALSTLPASQLGSQTRATRAVHLIVHGTAGSGCLTAMQVAWIVHGCLRLRVGVGVY